MCSWGAHVQLYTQTYICIFNSLPHTLVFFLFFGGSQRNDDNLDRCVSLPNRSSQLTHRPGTPADAV